MSSCVTNFPSLTLKDSSYFMETLTTFPSLLRKSVFRSRDKSDTGSVQKITKRATSIQKQRHEATKADLRPFAGSQREAQTALLLSVIRATPNDVFYTIAKDFLVDACNKAVAFFKPLLASGGELPLSPSDSDDRSECRTCPHCQSSSGGKTSSVLQSAEFLIFKAFIKLVVKLYLTLILEVTTVALKLLG